MKSDDFDEALDIVRDEYDKAIQKHPVFARTRQEVVSIIAEELGELAMEMNDFECCPGWVDRAITEAAHVAVTAIRTIQMLKGVYR